MRPCESVAATRDEGGQADGCFSDQVRNDQGYDNSPCRLRACAKITSHFRIPSSGHLCPILNRKVLEIGLLFLWLCNFGSNKSDLNLGANSVKLFLRKPLGPKYIDYLNRPPTNTHGLQVPILTEIKEGWVTNIVVRHFSHVLRYLNLSQSRRMNFSAMLIT